MPELDGTPAKAFMAFAGVLLNALATAAYIGVRLGPGPRDGLMTALARVTGRSIRLVRTAIEALAGVLGGTQSRSSTRFASGRSFTFCCRGFPSTRPARGSDT